MKKKPTNIPASVLAKLKNIADKDKFDFNFLLVRYIQERFLARLAVSGHVNKFVLKGGFLLLAYNIEKARPTKDIDFLGINVSRDRKELERLVREIALVDLSDGVRFLPESVRSTEIKENADYEGIRIKLAAKVGSAKSTIQIDCGFGEIVSPHPLQMDYPTLLHKEGIKVLAYSKETIVAEKLEAIVKLTTFNTRVTTREVFSEIFKVIQVFIAPIIEAEMEGKSLSLNWDRTTNKWRSKKQSFFLRSDDLPGT